MNFSGFDVNNAVLKPLANRTKPPRFFSQEEWNAFNDKEKLWIKYKHFWVMKSQGDTEISVIEGIIYLGVGAATFLNYWNLSMELMYFFPVWLAGSWWLKYKFGDYKDRKDLIALESEVSNRRNKVFREIREMNGHNKVVV